MVASGMASLTSSNPVELSAKYPKHHHLWSQQFTAVHFQRLEAILDQSDEALLEYFSSDILQTIPLRPIDFKSVGVDALDTPLSRAARFRQCLDYCFQKR